MVKKSRILFASTNCVFRSNHCDPRFPFKTICMTSLEREDFKLSIGSLNNKFPYTVEGLLNILQQHNMAANGNKECKPKIHML